jgi:hypothetical protein
MKFLYLKAFGDFDSLLLFWLFVKEETLNWEILCDLSNDPNPLSKLLVTKEDFIYL